MIRPRPVEDLLSRRDVGARSAPPGHTTVPVSASTVTFANPSGVRACANTGPCIIARRV